MKTNTTTPVVPTSSAFAALRRDKPAAIVPGGFTLGLDPGLSLLEKFSFISGD
jgi:hypothetical protein